MNATLAVATSGQALVYCEVREASVAVEAGRWRLLRNTDETALVPPVSCPKMSSSRPFGNHSRRHCRYVMKHHLFLAFRKVCFLFLIPLHFAFAAAPSPNWQQLTPKQSPPERYYPAMAYDAVSGKVLLFGGFGGTDYLNDTWTFDGTTWSRIDTPIAPSARVNMQMAYDRRSHRIVLFGGFDGEFLNDTWTWDGTNSTWSQATPNHSPQPVNGAAVFADPKGRVDIFGGFNGMIYLSQMFQWNGKDWQKLTPPTLPYGRSDAGLGVDTHSGKVVIFGGLNDTVNPTNTWVYDGSNWTLETPRTQPIWLYGSAGVFDPNLHSVILFGGGSGGVQQNATWAWIGSDWKQVFTAQSPSPREGAGIAWDAVLGHVILFGGGDNNNLFSDTWELSP